MSEDTISPLLMATLKCHKSQLKWPGLVVFYALYILSLTSECITAHQSRFTKVRNHSKLVTSATKYHVLSSVNCATFCASSPACIGFNLHRTGPLNSGRQCAFLILDDLDDGTVTPAADFYIYIKEAFVNTFEEVRVLFSRCFFFQCSGNNRYIWQLVLFYPLSIWYLF